jgi:hypothetical protein
MDSTVLYYEAITLPLDEENELHISTYPAGFPNITDSTPFLYKALETPKQVYLQAFVRPVGQKGGPNPNVENIVIHSVSYKFPSLPPRQLTSDFEHYLWMQGDSRYENPEYKATDSTPIPHGDQWYFTVAVDVTLNGQRHRVEGEMHAARKTIRQPLISQAFQ